MFTRVLLSVALLLPIAAHAEDMYRWRDAKGRLHYSNDTEKVPAGSQVVTKQLGHIGGQPIGEAMEAPAPRERTVEPGWVPTTSCVGDMGLFALPHRSVDLDRRGWFEVDRACGRQHDIEAWLRDATTALELRKIGL